MTEEKTKISTIRKLTILLLAAKKLEENFELREAYLRGYRDGILALCCRKVWNLKNKTNISKFK